MLPVLPSLEDFPYTIRLVTEILSSNGSTSMASVCGSSLALMDAGVPTRAAVGGIAMGLITDEGGRYAVLTDIQGVEDNLGDMDFKVAGTARGVTALQMDIKAKGLTNQVLEEALQQAREARLVILETMNATLPQPRAQMSPFAPRIITLTIHPDKIRDVIGPGGKVIRKIIEETGVTIDIEDDGRVFIGSTSAEASEQAIKRIKDLTDEVAVGQVYRGKVVRIMPFGAFVELTANQDGLVHVSQLEDTRVERVEDSVSIGDIIAVKVVEIDEKGRVNLSRKQVPPAARQELGGEVIAPKVPRPAGEPTESYSGGGYGANRGGGGGRDRGGRGGRR
jgi:polyribonucleotide nucleotidyltransferase